ncbi:L-type lectin-domain containing receptor kinase IV.1 [Trifolium repens]|nr:L-type lectin-domain containing receptor kinase IV.1 [Trifolium repens]
MLVASKDNSFIYNGFQSADLYLDGNAELTSNGLLRLTNDIRVIGHALYLNPIVFKKTSHGNVSSFSTTFVFAIRSQHPTHSRHGIVFVVSPTKGLPYSQPGKYLGLFNVSNIGNSSNHVFGVELDTKKDFDFGDINNNHVGININGLNSTSSARAGYYDQWQVTREISLSDGDPIQVWIEYDGVKKKIDVTLAPINVVKPTRPLLSTTKDLSPILNDTMYVGFSSATGLIHTSHYILGWSFKVDEWEQVVIHRDIKASNVMLDAEFNARLGDFGLSRLYDHGTDPYTTHVAGTVGYLAPEHTRTGKATKFSDVYAFGAFLLEVVCGRRPIERVGKYESVILVDCVFKCWERGEILEAKDVNLGSDYVSEEVELVLKLGLLCSHLEPLARPSMRQVMQYLEKDIPMPDLSLLSLSPFGLTFGYQEFVTDKTMSHPSTSIVESLLSGGR